jgi:hypothetical protein
LQEAKKEIEEEASVDYLYLIIRKNPNKKQNIIAQKFNHNYLLNKIRFKSFPNRQAAKISNK